MEVHVDKKSRGSTGRRLWKWMKRRSAIEPDIGHLKAEHRMERNRLLGEQGDMINAILSAAGMNFGKLLKKIAVFWLKMGWLLERFCRELWSSLFASTRCPA